MCNGNGRDLQDVIKAAEAAGEAMQAGKADHGIQRVAWSLLAEWWCVPVNLDEDTAAQVIMDSTMIPVGGDVELIKDRLYGGFRCGDHDTHRHVCFATGEYTYLGHNGPNEGRAGTWAELIEESKGTGPFIGGGPFCLDAPGRTT